MQSADRSQEDWAKQPIKERVGVLKKARHLIADRTTGFCNAISPELPRNAADTLVAEILPLLEACRFVERNAANILKPKKLGRHDRPFWLSGVSSEVHRVPFGRVLVIAPSNYPLFLPGVQALQALAAGNCVIWKPGRGGGAIAMLFASVMREAGLPDGLLTVTDESVAAAQNAIAAGVDKVFFTGSAAHGKVLLHQLADTLTPCVVELSGCDAVFVLPSADISRVVKALAFGMRLNGSATCMAPRRVFLIGADEQRRKQFLDTLFTTLGWVRGIPLPESVRQELRLLVDDAKFSGAQLHGQLESAQQPVVISNATPRMLAAQTDIFAPLLAIMDARDIQEAIALHGACSYALTASIFGNEREARTIVTSITVGTVTINDLIVPTADPRVSFGGRRSSGFGLTRGAEGLLEMTAAKTVTIRRGSSTRNYDATTALHEQLFEGVIRMSHNAKLKQRLAGIQRTISAGKKLSGKQ